MSTKLKSDRNDIKCPLSSIFVETIFPVIFPYPIESIIFSLI